jgi:phosphatidylglycerophosphatase C
VKKGLALFDFDGTITTHDTLLEIIKYQKGKFHFYAGLLVLTPIMILYKVNLIANWRAKEMMLAFFFANTPLDEFQKKCTAFVHQRLPSLLKEEAIKSIEHHLRENNRVIVVSASASNWIEDWCKSMNIELIATQLQVKNEHITGKLDSLNCYGAEKVNRIKAHLKLSDYSPIYAYGDSAGDKEMLALADFPFYRKYI